MKDRIKSKMAHGITGLERVNPYQPKKIVAFFGVGRVNPFQPKKCSIWRTELKV
jgi:hypothetical protein